MKVLKPFDYSHDGVHAKHLEPGDDPSDVPAECLPGLIAEGYLSAEVETKVVEVAPETGEMVGLKHPADGTLSPPLEGEGAGEALPPITDAPKSRRSRKA